MGTILLLLFIFFIVIPLCKIAWRIWQVHSTFNRMRRQMNDAARASSGNASADPRGRQPRRPRKKIDPTVGEYVAFEEVETRTTASETSGADSRTGFKTESQVEDAVWEEIR